jgi:glycosyltransferase 2 family protein
MKTRRRVFWKVALSLGLLGLVVYFVDFRQVAAMIATANPWHLAAVAGLIQLDRALMAYKWNRLLVAMNVHLPFSRLFLAYSVAPLAGIVLPSTIGGDAFRVYMLTRDGADSHALLASIVVERVIAVIAMLVLATISFGLMASILEAGWGHIIAVGAALGLGILLTGGLLGMLHPRCREYIARLARRFTKYPLVDRLHQIYWLCCEYRKHMGTVAAVAGWTLLEQMVPIISLVLIVRALHIDVPLWALIVVIPLAVLAVRLPVSLDGLGVQEGVYVGLFGLAGMTVSEAFLLSTVARVLPLLSVLPWGIYYIVKGRQQDHQHAGNGEPRHSSPGEHSA